MTLSALPRSPLVCSIMLPRVPLRLQRQKFMTTARRLNAGNNTKHYSQWKLLALSGFAGGAVTTVVGGYAFYHWSGLGDLVEIVRRVLGEPSPGGSPNAVGAVVEAGATAASLAVLRQIVKAHVEAVPGAGVLVDLGFNKLDKVVEAYKEEAHGLLGTAIADVVQARGEELKGTIRDILEKGQGVVSDLSRMLTPKPETASTRCEVEPPIPNTFSQAGKPTEIVPNGQNPGSAL